MYVNNFLIFFPGNSTKKDQKQKSRQRKNGRETFSNFNPNEKLDTNLIKKPGIKKPGIKIPGCP